MSYREQITHARLPVVLGAALLMAVAVLYADIPFFSLLSIACISLGSLLIHSIYTFNSWTDFNEDLVNSPEFASAGTRARRKVLALSLASGTASIMISVFFGFLSFATVSFMLVMGLMYSYPVLGRWDVPRFKEIPVFKNVVAALMWSVMLTLPFSASGILPGMLVILLILFVFLQILIESISRDLPDMRGDRGAGFSTIPSAMGLRKTLLLLLAVNTASVAVISACATMALYTSLILIGCAWRYYVLLLLFGDRPLSLTFAKVNFPTLLALVVGAVMGKLFM